MLYTSRILEKAIGVIAALDAIRRQEDDLLQ